MCGIAGFLNTNGAPADPSLLDVMVRRVAHRGPDGQGAHLDGPLALGHRRLAVLDLSPAGAQPMASADGTCWITYNGELFNVRELRGELEALGHRFRSRSDTEVILAAYQAWGLECVHRFNGMFAWALWDSRRRQLWLVRDRLGVKPLFYAQSGPRLAFGSEAKAVLPALAHAPQLDEAALRQFLFLNYTPAPWTLFRGVRQLAPGHWLTCTSDGAASVTRYWRLPQDLADADRPAEQLAALLNDAVRARLLSDVPVGALLSGGLDSAAIVAWMQRHRGEPAQTFTATFEDASYDEGPWAEQTAAALGTRHHQQPVSDDDLARLPALVWHGEELTADSSMLAVYRVAELARRHVTVVLTGDGADELFAGYPTYTATWGAGAYRWLPAFLRRGVASLANRLPIDDAKASLESRLRRFVAADVTTPARAHASWRAITSEAQRRALWPDSAGPSLGEACYAPWFAASPSRGAVRCALDADLGFYLPNDMLVKVDRMTMAWGLEARTPYLDYRVVEFAARLRARALWRPIGPAKRLLRDATRGLLPDAIRRRPKAGFNLPVARWLREPARPMLERHLLDARPSALAMFRREELTRLVHEHLARRADHSHRLWGLLSLSLWSQLFLDQTLAPPAAPTPAASSALHAVSTAA